MLSRPVTYRYRRILRSDTAMEQVWAPEGVAPLEQKKTGQPISVIPHGGSAMEQLRPSVPSTVVPEQSPESLQRLRDIVRNVATALGACYDGDVKHILSCYEVILELFYVYGFNYERFPSQTLESIVLSSVQDVQTFQAHGGVWVQYFKWKIAAFFSVWMDQVIPESPPALINCSYVNPKYLLGGPFYSFLRLLMRDKEMKRSFCLSTLQAKKGMPRPDQNMVKSAAIKNMMTMTQPKPQNTFHYEWEMVPEPNAPLYDCLWKFPYKVNSTLRAGVSVRSAYTGELIFGKEFAIQQIRRTTDELFKSFNMPLAVLTDFFLPSGSANYNWTRDKWGTYGEIEASEEWKKLCATVRENPDFYLRFKTKMVNLSNRVSEYYGAAGRADQSLLDLQDDLYEVIGCEIENHNFLTLWRKFYWQMVSKALVEPPLVQVVGLSEALKVRCISKGPPITYFVLKPFQKAFWSQLQRFWNFELTGTPVTTELMNKRFGRMAAGTRFHSGDYSAATDELYSWPSEIACETIFDNLSQNSGLGRDAWGCFETLCKRALTGHYYTYTIRKPQQLTSHDQEFLDQLLKVGETQTAHKEQYQRWLDHIKYGPHLGFGSEEFTFILPQVRGQLMGSIVSFPFLCIVNIAMIRAAWELSHKRFIRLSKLPVWINGDDCLTAYTSDTFPELWVGITSLVGFKESVGKTYDSHKMASINSHFYYLTKKGRWVEIPYINMGLVKGLNRSSAIEDDCRKAPYELGSCHHELLRTCGPVLERNTHKIFMFHNAPTLREFPGPWFMPQYLCGVGLKNLEPLTRVDCQRVTIMREAYASHAFEPPTPPTDKEWVHYDRFLKVMRLECPLAVRYPFKNFEGEETYSKAFFSVILWLWANLGLEALTNKHQMVNRYYNKLAKIQTFVSRELQERGNRVVPADKDFIDHEAKPDVLPVWCIRENV